MSDVASTLAPEVARPISGDDESNRARGRVAIVGAGPGDPELLTLRAKACLERADVVLYDYLVNPAVLQHARPGTELIFVGKRGHGPSVPQREIDDMLVAYARAGSYVVRLKGGDPFVFGRGAEEAEALVAAGIPFEVVPGVSAAVAVPAYAGIPVTHRGLASSFAVLTGHEAPGKDESDVDWAAAAGTTGTLVLMMGVSNLERIAERLIALGRSPETPVAVIRWGTYEFQETVTGTLETIGAILDQRPMKPPAVIVVGDVVGLRERLSWFEPDTANLRAGG